jgi:hypothetical protein
MKSSRRNALSRLLAVRVAWKFFLKLSGKTRGQAHQADSPGILLNFANRIQPKPFFSGSILGVLTILTLGAWAKHFDTFGDRVRFFQAVSPERAVYPTIYNLMAFVRGKADPRKTLVLVSGSSICLGIGQPEDDLWSRRLQETLGEDFCVVNTSFRSSRYNLIGLPLIRMLRKEFPRSIFISDISPNDRGPTPIYIDNPNVPYNYVSWQSLAREVFQGDSAALAEAFTEFSDCKRDQRIYAQEQFLSGAWEFFTGASSFWNWMGYRICFTANPFSHPLKRVRLLRDDERRENYLPSPERFLANRVREMDILHQQIRQGKFHQAAPSNKNDAHLNLAESFRDEDLKRRAVFLVNAWSSYYVNQLNHSDQLFYKEMVSHQVLALKNLGFGAVAVGLNYPFSYYVDGQHFSWEASQIIAEAAAKEVQRVCRTQGF